MQHKVRVNTHYTRSVNLERDSSSTDVVKAYIPTSRALRTFNRVSTAFHNGQAPRAWSLVGPYGSGKSSFAVFMSQLLSRESHETTKVANAILKKSDADLAKVFNQQVEGNDGYLKVLITGAPEPMAKRIVKGLYDAADTYWGGIKGRRPKIVTKLELAINTEQLKSADILALIKELQEKIEPTGCKGILLVIDELGKFLEFEARHYGANDIYLLQSLAEHACKGGEVNLFLFVLLHQSFEQYAKGLGESLKNEWSKVQGRFEEVPFLESSEQVLRIVSAAFRQNLEIQEQKSLKDTTEGIVDLLLEHDALPGALSKRQATELFVSCYPLHPVSAVLLPLLCQKIAQNERTLFSYLGSQEEFGLLDMLSKLDDISESIKPHHIYDYFVSNQPAVMGDYLTHRRWAEVVTAIERLGDANEDELHLLKTIGILNIVGSKAGFKASKEILETCCNTKSQFKKASDSLKTKSVINYRKFNKEYRVWQGSDFDLEAAVQEESNSIGNFSLATELNDNADMQPIVARRYTIENGALRYFLPSFVDAYTYKSIQVSANEARIIFYLAGGQDDEETFRSVVSNHFSELDIVVLCLSGSQLREAVAETLTLKRVHTNSQALNSDPIAKREFEDRLTAAEQSQDSLLQNLIDSPQKSEWWHGGKRLRIDSRRALQENLSAVLKEVFSKSPVVFNELINRDKPSSQAIAARNKLLFAMLNYESERDFGIEKFPPEKTIYRAVLKETGLHTVGDEGHWAFAPPSGKKAISANIKHVWKRIDEFLASTERYAKSFADLNEELQAPPYGVKAGLLPILYIASYIVNQHELAIYESRTYRPYFTEEMLDRFVKRPDEFTVQRFRIEGVKADIFKKYGEVIQSKDGSTPTLLELAKPLASFMAKLPEYTKKTRKGLSDRAQSVRRAFNLSKSPERLLFEQLPQALGYELNNSTGNLDGFSEALKGVLGELKRAHEKLLEKQIELIAEATKIDSALPISDIRKQTHGRFSGLENYTIDTQGLRAFILRLTKTAGSDSEWLENILMFLGHKPSAKWLDADQDQAEYRLANFSKNLLDLRRIRLYEDNRTDKIDADFDVYLLRSFKKGSKIQDQVVAIDKRQLAQVKELKFEVVKKLEDIDDKELQLAVVAELVNDFLHDYNQSVSEKSPSAKLKTTTLKEVLK